VKIGRSGSEESDPPMLKLQRDKWVLK